MLNSASTLSNYSIGSTPAVPDPPDQGPTMEVAWPHWCRRQGNFFLLSVNSALKRPKGMYMGEGVTPVSVKLAAKIRNRESVDMGKLLPEFWSGPKDDYSKGRKMGQEGDRHFHQDSVLRIVRGIQGHTSTRPGGFTVKVSS